MKNATLLAILVLALTMVVSAQTTIDFTGMPDTGSPQALPENYAGLHWSGLDYISVMKWDYSDGTIEYGEGFMAGPEAMVAFAGGPMCYQKHGGNTIKNICEASISAGVGPTALTQFRPDYMIVAPGWDCDGSQFIVVDAYNFGVKVASRKFTLQIPAAKVKLVLPDAWGAVTELRIHPSPGGSFVMYVLELK